MKTLRIITLYLLLYSITSSCTEQVDIEKYIKSQPTNTLVIEGLITDELKQHTVKLTRSGKALPDSPYEVVSEAEVTITDGTTIFILNELKDQPGVYQTDSLRGEVGKHYTLLVEINNATFEATDEMVPVLPFGQSEGIRLASNQPPKGYIQSPLIVFGSDAPNMITTRIDNPDPGAKYTQLDYYTFPGVDPDNILPKSVEATLSYNHGTQLTQLKYSLSREYYLFLRALLLETEYKGGVFGSVRSNVPTNVSNGGYGFFGAAAVIKRTGTVDENGQLR
jgi:hypothetical protein